MPITRITEECLTHWALAARRRLHSSREAVDLLPSYHRGPSADREKPGPSAPSPFTRRTAGAKPCIRLSHCDGNHAKKYEDDKYNDDDHRQIVAHYAPLLSCEIRLCRNSLYQASIGL